MRYMKNVLTGETIAVGDDDDARFEELKAARQDSGCPLYEQTGAHDPAVSQVEVAGQDPANGAAPITPGATTIPGRALASAAAEPSADADDLDGLTREALDDRARAAGVEAPGKLPNKDAVVDAIRGARA